MKSDYLISAEDFEIGDFAFVDEKFRKTEEEPQRVEIIDINQISAFVKNAEGFTYRVMRNRLTRNVKDENTV